MTGTGGTADGVVANHRLGGGGAPSRKGKGPANLSNSKAAPMVDVGGAVSIMPTVAPSSVAAVSSATRSPPPNLANSMEVDAPPRPTLAMPTEAAAAACSEFTPSRSMFGGDAESVGFGGVGGSAGPACQGAEIAKGFAGVPWLSKAGMGVSGATSAGGALDISGVGGSAGPACEGNDIAEDDASAPLVSEGVAAARPPPPSFPCMTAGTARGVAESAAAVAGQPASGGHSGSASVPNSEGGGGAGSSQNQTLPAAGQEPVAESASSVAASEAPEEAAASSSESTPVAALAAPAVAAAASSTPTPPFTRALASIAAGMFASIARSTTNRLKRERGSEVYFTRVLAALQILNYCL